MKKANILLWVAVVMLSFTACQQSTETKPSEETSTTTTANTEMMELDSVFIHTVFFYFKEGVTEEQRTKFEMELGKLAKCESIYKVWSGKAAGTARDVVDNSYDHAWVVHFENKAQQDLYQVDPIHLAFIEACKEIWDHVQVYDSVMKKL